MKDIRKKTDKDLRKFIAEKREELREERFKTAGSGLRDVKRIKNVKKEIAQALTEQNQRVKKSVVEETES